VTKTLLFLKTGYGAGCPNGTERGEAVVALREMSIFMKSFFGVGNIDGTVPVTEDVPQSKKK
jgi:hypothetical protein